MNIRKLCSELARREKTKSQAKIQAIRSIIGHLSDIVFDECLNGTGRDGIYPALGLNGARRAKRKKK